MCGNLKQKCRENKQILTSTSIGTLLYQSSGNEALFQQLLTGLTRYVPFNDILEEIDHIPQTFHRVNGYSNQFISNIINQVKTGNQETPMKEKKALKTFSFATIPREERSTIMKTSSKELNRTLSENVKMEVIYTGTNLGSQFNIKDPIPKRDSHNIIYHVVCLENNCNKIILVNVQEDSKKELKVIMIETKTYICYVTR